MAFKVIQGLQVHVLRGLTENVVPINVK